MPGCNGAGHVIRIVCLAIVGVVSFQGCAADRPASSPPTKKEVQGDSDRFFDKLKEEERERGRTSESPMR